jgi:predicted permease
MIIQHLFPVFALIFLGAALKQRRMTDAAFLATTDRLVYYIFFPVLLFWKIGAAPHTFAPAAVRFYLAVVIAVAAVYVLSALYIWLLKVPDFQAGAFSQSCYRFNTYVGMAIILSVMGEGGVAQFGILIGVVIPIINVLAVATLIWFSGQPGNWRRRLRMTTLSILTNPLVLGCAAGLLYARWVNFFPRFIDNTLSLGASLTLPLALISVGGSLTPRNLARHFRLASTGAVFKLVLLPVAGYGTMRLLGVTGDFMTMGMLFFALPTSTAIYVLSSQLGSDTEFASAAIMLSTGLSFFSLSAVLWWMHA